MGDIVRGSSCFDPYFVVWLENGRGEEVGQIVDVGNGQRIRGFEHHCEEGRVSLKRDKGNRAKERGLRSRGELGIDRHSPPAIVGWGSDFLAVGPQIGE